MLSVSDTLSQISKSGENKSTITLFVDYISRLRPGGKTGRAAERTLQHVSARLATRYPRQALTENITDCQSGSPQSIYTEVIQPQEVCVVGYCDPAGVRQKTLVASNLLSKLSIRLDERGKNSLEDRRNSEVGENMCECATLATIFVGHPKAKRRGTCLKARNKESRSSHRGVSVDCPLQTS